GLPAAPWTVLRDNEIGRAHAAVADAGLPYPLFVKPANMGSSVGGTKVHRPGVVDAAVELAASYDEWVVIEEGITGREIEVGVIGNADVRASVPGEGVASREFYDYEDKYLEGACD